ncbi:hypothetical protein GCM10027348_06520 [Hymenobacter tenuis]
MAAQEQVGGFKLRHQQIDARELDGELQHAGKVAKPATALHSTLHKDAARCSGRTSSYTEA